MEVCISCVVSSNYVETRLFTISLVKIDNVHLPAIDYEERTKSQAVKRGGQIQFAILEKVSFKLLKELENKI